MGKFHQKHMSASPIIQRSYFFVLIVLVFFSCKKEADNRIPAISYLQPSYLQQFSVEDTIPVKAQVQDEKEITRIQVSLVDANFSPVSAPQLFYPATASYLLDTRLPIPDQSLESGNYYVFVKADNGVNFKNKYQEVILHGLDQEYLQTVVITEGGLNQVQVFGTSDFEGTSLLKVITGDFSASAISSKDKLLFVAGRNNTNLWAYDLDQNEVAWTREITPGLPIHNNGCLHFNDFLYATYNYDFIHGYTPSGNIGFDVSIEEFDAPERIYRHGEFVLAEVQKKNAIDPYIATYFASTGNEKQRRFIDFDIVDFHAKNKDEVIVACNQEGKGMLYSYNVTNDMLTFILEFQDKINASVKTGTNTLALAGESGIYSYSMVYGIVTEILDSGADVLVFEHLSGSLITGKFTQLELYSYPEMVNQKTLLFSDTILDIQIQYSK